MKLPAHAWAQQQQQQQQVEHDPPKLAAIVNVKH